MSTMSYIHITPSWGQVTHNIKVTVRLIFISGTMSDFCNCVSSKHYTSEGLMRRMTLAPEGKAVITFLWPSILTDGSLWLGPLVDHVGQPWELIPTDPQRPCNQALGHTGIIERWPDRCFEWTSENHENIYMAWENSSWSVHDLISLCS